MHHQIELIAGIFVVVIGLGILARWLRMPYPILLVLAGLLLSLQDGVESVRLDPDLVLLGFLPPLLYAAAFQTDWRAFRHNLRSILLMAVGLVLFTITLVAWAAHDWLGMSWPAGFVLGAIVSPPDAVAAVAVTRQLRVPKRVITILEGESLVNDASALVTLRIAAAVLAGQAFQMESAATEFLKANVGGIAIGIFGGWFIVRVHQWMKRTGLGEPKLHIAISLLTPYLVYLPAERLHVSGVLAVVSTGLYVCRKGCEGRQAWFSEAKTVWDMVEFLLTGFIFLLIGFQLPIVLEALNEHNTLPRLCGSAAIISGVVIVARLIWMFPGAYLPRWLDRRILGHGEAYPHWRAVVVVGWAGMRGVVSLAAAMSLPLMAGSQPFPDRNLILFLTFGVILATLVGQGLTLPAVIRWAGRSMRDGEAQTEHSRGGEHSSIPEAGAEG